MRLEWTRRKLAKLRGRRHIPRKPFESACYAPTTSMYFDQHGNVRACCQNTGSPMGNVTEQSIRSIWESRSTHALRDALREGDFSQGCGFCQWQHDQGDHEILFARNYDHLPVAIEQPEWPVQMEFALTNACNLQCVMCNGDWSSSIRAHREHRAPLPQVYDEEFFAELAEFLPHLRHANFVGGEPLLGREPLRVLSMLADLKSPPKVSVTTNGTQWTPRVDEICDRLPMSFVLSLDGITRETYETIRVGASFDQVMTNLDRFQDHAERNGTSASITHCLMVPNHHEFGRMLRFAEDRNIDLDVNQVLFPTELSLFQLPASALREAVSTMESDVDGYVGSLGRLRPVWDNQLAALHHRLDEIEGGSAVFVRPWSDDGNAATSWSEQATDILTEWEGDVAPIRLVLDATSRSLEVAGSSSDLIERLGLLEATDMEEFLGILARVAGTTAPQRMTNSGLLQDVVVGDDGPGSPLQFRAAWDDCTPQTTILLAIRNPPPEPRIGDPLATLVAEHGTGRVLELSFSAEGTVIDAIGAHWIIGAADKEELVGATRDGLLSTVERSWGPTVILPGPSGDSDDTWVASRNPDGGVVPRVRAIIDSNDDGATVYLAAPVPEHHDQHSVEFLA